MRLYAVLLRAPVVLAALLLGACAPRMVTTPAPAAGLPPVPRVEAPLEIRVVHPTPETPRPNVDSTFVFGSVGTGEASLAINGAPVEVAPNGAFLAFLPVPADGRYELVARAGDDTASATVSYRMPPPPDTTRAIAPGDSAAIPVDTATVRADTAAARADSMAASLAVPPAPTTFDFPETLVGRVIGVGDTLATGSGVAFGRRGLTGAFVWMLPRGARLPVVGKRAGQYALRLGAEPVAFIPDSLVAVGGPVPATPPAVGPVTLRPAEAWVDVVVPADSAAFLVEESGSEVALTLYGRTPPAGAAELAGDRLVAGAEWSAPAPDAARLSLRLERAPWGFKAFYADDGDLVLRLRRPPPIDPRRPLQGRRIVVDPGHPPGGATGPTGLTEAEANLAISQRIAERLRERGAEVFLTRISGESITGSPSSAVELPARAALAVREDAELFVSVHNNAFPEGVNPFVNAGTEVYYHHGQSRDLAEALNAEIAAVTRVPDLGVKASDFAVVRQSWMPAVLTESLFMMIPEQEAALRDPEFVDRLAAAHVRGIETFLRGRAGGAAR